MPSYVTMLRLLVSPDPLSNTAFFTSLANSADNKAVGAGAGGMGAVKGEDLSVTVLKRDLKRAKWLDDATTDLGLIRYTHTHNDDHVPLYTHTHIFVHTCTCMHMHAFIFIIERL